MTSLDSEELVDKPKGCPAGKDDFELAVERIGTDNGVVGPRKLVDEALIAGLVKRDDRSPNVSFENVAQELIEITGHLRVDSAEPSDRIATEPLRHAEVVRHDISVLCIESHVGKFRPAAQRYETASVIIGKNCHRVAMRRRQAHKRDKGWQSSPFDGSQGLSVDS